MDEIEYYDQYPYRVSRVSVLPIKEPYSYGDIAKYVGRYAEMTNWCDEYLPDRWSADKYGFMFTYESDATMFILKWSGSGSE